MLCNSIDVFADSSSRSEMIFDVITAVLIVACPCALALSIPFTFGNAIRSASRNQWYFKRSDIIEKLGGITDIVFDKTGTLTKNQLTVGDVVLFNDKTDQNEVLLTAALA